MLVEAGYDVTGVTRTPAKVPTLRDAGAEAVVVDCLDAEAVRTAVTDAHPDVIIHQLTAISDVSDVRHFDRVFAPTNRLRTVGTDNLLAGARAAGTKRFIAQSFAGWPYARVGGPVKTEQDPLDTDPPAKLRSSLEAIKYIEDAVTSSTDVEGLVLRYGGLYGPGTSIAVDGEQTAMIRKRRFPMIGNGAGVWSMVHVRDAAGATVAAIDHGAPGIYNIVDDDPAPVSQWLPALADALDAKPPMHVPSWVGRIAAGDHAVMMMTQIRGADNAKAKRELAWTPEYPTWREGIRTGLA
jgi:nucleoside-diphosphate-sugar epimerase